MSASPVPPLPSSAPAAACADPVTGETASLVASRPRRRLATGVAAALLAGATASLAPRAALAQAKAGTVGTGPAMSTRPEVQTFIDEMVTRNGFDRDELQKLFGRIQRVDRVIDLMTAPARPGARRIWSEYRARFVDDFRINEGIAFWRRNAAPVKLASARSGVPEAIIVAIIGVETVYGRHTGDFRVADTLTTLGFDYPARAPYFRGELEQFLLYTRENRIDPLTPRGSYAGATGLGQFMPTSLRRWAIDLDGDGRIDLLNSAADAVGSVGNFLKEHGWIEGKATHYGAAVVEPNRLDELVAAGPKPSFTVEQLYERGVRATDEVPVGDLLVLADLPEGDNPTRYVLGTENFYAITRYNRSYFYAMAVIELAAALKAR